tara:strand:- start:69746 stop:70090 length:345 start_codon:yes stop_codon:yes gene_type:complete
MTDSTFTENTLERIASLEEENRLLRKALSLEESYCSRAEQENYEIWKLSHTMGFYKELVSVLEKGSSEKDVNLFIEYMGSEGYVGEDEYDKEGRRSLEEHKERQEAYNSFEEDM